MGEIYDVVSGAKHPLAWLASGRKPVDQAASLSRAGTCVSCPKNGSGPLTEWFTEPAAAVIKKAIEKRTGYKMQTLYDAALGVCEACHCVMVLKVHEPIDLVLKGLKPEAKAKLWGNCWILKESSEPQTDTDNKKYP